MMNTKELREQLTALKEELRTLAEVAVNEKRDWTPEEKESYTAKENEMRSLEETIAKIENVPEVEKEERQMENVENKMTVEEQESRAFADFCMGKVAEMRAGEKNFTIGDNGAVVPVTIARRIIKAVHERCPVFAEATRYSVAGDLRVPVYGKNGTHDISVGYQEDFTAITADAGKLDAKVLQGHLCGALSLVGKRLQNNSVFDITEFVIGEIADKMALFLERELLNGTGTNAMEGITVGCSNTATATTLTSDALIDLQSKVPTAYQTDAVWTMSPATFNSIRKIKDKNDRYLLNNDISSAFPWVLLGKKVHISDAMADNKIIYGDYKGLSVNVRENINVEVLKERYADMHALGVICYCEADSKVTNNQMLAVLTIGS